MNLARAYDSDGNGGQEADQSIDLAIIGYSSMGTLKGSYGSIQVEARETILSEHRLISHSVRMEVRTGDDYPQTAVGTLAQENITQFVSALERLQTTAISRDRFDFTEIQFELEGNKVTVFNNDRGELFWAFQVEGLSIHFTSLAKLGDLAALVNRAKSHLEKTRI